MFHYKINALIKIKYEFIKKITFYLGLITICITRSYATEVASFFGPNKEIQLDADVMINGMAVKQKIYSKDGKIRVEDDEAAGKVIFLIRPDLKKIFSLDVDRKVAQEIDYSPREQSDITGVAAPPKGIFKKIGLEKLGAIGCTKYRVESSTDNKIYFAWVDAATNYPVKVISEDRSIEIHWGNYKHERQNASLFDIPYNFKLEEMPSNKIAPNI